MDFVSINKIARPGFNDFRDCSLFPVVIAGANDLNLVANIEAQGRSRRTIPVRQNDRSTLELPGKHINDAPAFGALLQMLLFPSL